jgi:thioredoxin 2
MGMTLDANGIIVTCRKCVQRNRLPYDRLGQATRCGKCQGDLPSPDAPIELPTLALFDALVTRSALPVLVDFWAAWCGPCKMVAPEFEKVAAATAGKIVVAKLDTEALPEVAERLQIISLPTFAVFFGGTELSRSAGARPAAAIQQFVEQAVRQGSFA